MKNRQNAVVSHRGKDSGVSFPLHFTRPGEPKVMLKKRKGMGVLLQILIAILVIVAIFALLVMMNMRFRAVIDTYMPFRMAVLVANALSSSPGLTAAPEAGGSAHKNLLSASKLDGYADAYRTAMPPASAMLCFHWRAAVIEPDTFGYWEFGHDPADDMSANALSAIESLPEDIYNQVSETPLAIFTGPGLLSGALLKEMLDMAPATYALPVSVMVTDAGAGSCASAGGKCRLWDPVFGDCYPSETPVGEKDCTLSRKCCVDEKFSHVGSVGATTPAMLEVTVWKAKSECKDQAIIRKIIEEVEKLAKA